MKRTPLYLQHSYLGGKFIDFGGWELPVQYRGIIEEHENVRQFAGLFDVSHMGEIEIKGPDALAAIQTLVTGDVERLRDKQVLYSLMCYEHGGIVDDLLIYRYNANHFLLVVNASNSDKDYTWIVERVGHAAEVKNVSSEYAQLALQGPRAEDILQQITAFPLNEIAFFCFEPALTIAGHHALVSRTGYTGEDGFEIYTTPETAPLLWAAIMDAGLPFGLLPIGLGARDTLRFEANLPLYGHEIGPDITPLEAGLGYFVKLNKGEFIGQRSLQKQQEQGVPRELIAFTMVERGVPRHAYPVTVDGDVVGAVTSGGFSPSLKQNIGLALVQRGRLAVGDNLDVLIRGKPTMACCSPLPFYRKRTKKKKI